MKIALINIYQDKNCRGAETYVAEIAKRLSLNNEVKVFSGDQIPKKRWPVLWRIYIDPFGFQTFWQTIRILPALWKGKFDSVIPVNGGWQPALIRIITWIYGGKMLISGQSGIGWDDRNNLWCFPDVFIALSSKAKDWAKRANRFVRVEYIPNGVDLGKFKPEGINYPTKLKKPIVICQGAAEPSKRLDLAIKAVSKLKNVSLLIVGTGSLRDNIFNLGRKVLGNRFEMINVLHEDMPSVYRLGNIFTLPSESTEAFGISNVEALATNLPVVATNDTTRREIIGEAGIFTDPKNIDAYAKAILSALSGKWGNIPRHQAEKFNWDDIAKKYEKLLQNLIK